MRRCTTACTRPPSPSAPWSARAAWSRSTATSPSLRRRGGEMPRPGGRTILGGVPRQEGETTFPSLLLSVSEKTLKGCYYGSASPPRDFPAMLSLYRAGRLDLDSLITQRLPLEGIN